MHLKLHNFKLAWFLCFSNSNSLKLWAKISLSWFWDPSVRNFWRAQFLVFFWALHHFLKLCIPFFWQWTWENILFFSGYEHIFLGKHTTLVDTIFKIKKNKCFEKILLFQFWCNFGEISVLSFCHFQSITNSIYFTSTYIYTLKFSPLSKKNKRGHVT